MQTDHKSKSVLIFENQSNYFYLKFYTSYIWLARLCCLTAPLTQVLLLYSYSTHLSGQDLTDVQRQSSQTLHHKLANPLWLSVRHGTCYNERKWTNDKRVTNKTKYQTKMFNSNGGKLLIYQEKMTL